MATYRKMLKDKDGNNILPIVGPSRYGWFVAGNSTAASGTAASSALALAEEYSGGADVLEINANRVRAKEAGLALVSGACYSRGGTSAQVWVSIAKYNTAGNAYTLYGRKAWTSTNETAGITLTLPMVPVPMAVGESLTIVGGSGSSYTIGGGSNDYNGIEVLFIPNLS